MGAGWHQFSDSELLERTAQDPEAFGAFYDRHARRILAFLSRRTGSGEVALDLTAEVFACALEASGRFGAGGDNAEAWLYAIARNKLADLYRAGRAQDDARRRLAMEPLQLTDEGLRRIDSMVGSDDVGSFLQALDDLPADERSALQERIIQERDYAELAQEFEVSESVVRKRVSRGLGRLRHRLGERS